MTRFRSCIFDKNIRSNDVFFSLYPVKWCTIFIIPTINDANFDNLILMMSVRLFHLPFHLVDKFIVGRNFSLCKYLVPHQTFNVVVYLYLYWDIFSYLIPCITIHYCHYLFWCLISPSLAKWNPSIWFLCLFDMFLTSWSTFCHNIMI